MLHFVFSSIATLKILATGAKKRLTTAVFTKPNQYYDVSFRTFVVFCICLKIHLSHVSELYLLALEYLATNEVLANMLAN